MTPADCASLAEAKHDAGYNCAQAVFLAFAAEIGLSEAQAAQFMQGFGGGMGGLGEACGALSGAVAAFSLLSDAVKPGDTEGKEAFYEKVKALGEAFRQSAGGTRCAELKDADPERKKLRCCGYIRAAARLTAEALGK